MKIIPYLPPSSQLPPIREIASHPSDSLSDALAYLRHIYNPEIRGTRRSKPRNIIKEGIYNSSTDAQALDGLDELRSDAFERSYAMRWLTALVAQAAEWESEGVDSPQLAISLEREVLLKSAASLLAICSGTSGAGVIVRDFIFDHISSRGDKLKVHIRDTPLDNRDYGSVGTQTWGGACVLSEMILDNPSQFGVLSPSDANLRILELGAGTGLVSLTVGKLLETLSPLGPRTTIISTDYYPSALENLAYNIRANFPFPDDSKTTQISSYFLDWSSFTNEPDKCPPLDTPFDVVLGADIIYETHHATWIKSCLESLLRKPSQDRDPLFHLMIPLRFTHSSESNTVETVFSGPSKLNTPASEAGIALRIVARDTILCDAGSGLGPDQIEYAYYKIGWR